MCVHRSKLTYLGAELDEDNFNIVLDGLTESAATSISLMTAEAQSKS